MFDHNLNDYQLVEWIVEDTGIPWLKLDFKIPWQLFMEDINRIDENEWQLYRPVSSNSKWYTVVLHGFENKPYTASNYGLENEERSWTTIGNKCSNIKQFLLNECHLKSQERTRIMRLDPGGEINLHQDRIDQNAPLTRDIMKLGTLHFVVNNPENCYFDIPHWGNIPLKNGDTFLFDNKWEHQLRNDSNVTRYHIIFNGADIGNDFWNEIVIRSWEKYKKHMRYYL